LLVDRDALSNLELQARVVLRELQVLQLVLDPLFVFTLTTAYEFADFNFGVSTFIIEVLQVPSDPP
jgi:hypothetical protein